MASGVPWPRMFSQPERAIAPSAASGRHVDHARPSGDMRECPRRGAEYPNQMTWVTREVRCIKSYAAPAPAQPTIDQNEHLRARSEIALPTCAVPHWCSADSHDTARLNAINAHQGKGPWHP